MSISHLVHSLPPSSLCVNEPLYTPFPSLFYHVKELLYRFCLPATFHIKELPYTFCPSSSFYVSERAVALRLLRCTDPVNAAILDLTSSWERVGNFFQFFWVNTGVKFPASVSLRPLHTLQSPCSPLDKRRPNGWWHWNTQINMLAVAK